MSRRATQAARRLTRCCIRLFEAVSATWTGVSQCASCSSVIDAMLDACLSSEGAARRRARRAPETAGFVASSRLSERACSSSAASVECQEQLAPVGTGVERREADSTSGRTRLTASWSRFMGSGWRWCPARISGSARADLPRGCGSRRSAGAGGKAPATACNVSTAAMACRRVRAVSSGLGPLFVSPPGALDPGRFVGSEVAGAGA
jgi:hypothetical protein